MTEFVKNRMMASVCYAVQGLFASDMGVVGTRAGDFESAVLMINPTGNAPLLAISSGFAEKAAKDSVVHWYEENKIEGRYQITNSAGTGTSIVVADGSAIVAGTVFMVDASGEYLYVTGVSGNNLTVVRAMAGTTNTSITANDYMTRVGNAREEGSAMPTAVVGQGHPRFNYTQIFRNAWSVTGTTHAIDFTTGSQVAKSKADCGLYHAEDMERAYLWGKKHIGTLNNKPFRMMDGVIQQIRGYGGLVQAQDNAHTSMLEIREYLRDLFLHNVKGKPNERLCFGGNGALHNLNEMARLDSEYSITYGQTSFGLKFGTFVCPFGEIKVMTHPLMNEHELWTYDLYFFHPGAIRRRPLRKTQDEAYDQNGRRIDGADADYGVLTTETCIEVQAASTCGIYTGITAAAASTTSS